jgi:hypothetical protein
MAKRNTEEQMKLFEEGGLKDEGGSVDPVSGNDVPSGSTQAEVRDDIPAQLSEGEFVFPADVVRYIGLENLMQLRSKAKQGLAKMEAMGQMGNSEDATMSDDVEFESDIDALIENFDPNDPSTMEFSQGGVVKAANGFFAQPQQFSYGYMPPGFGTQQQIPASGLSYRSPQIPMAQPFVTSAGQSAGASVGTGTGMQDNIEQRQYIGPNGELITIMFKNGVPQQKVPEGYKVYKPEEVVTPEVKQPEVTSPGSSGDDRESERERQEEYSSYRNNMDTISKLDERFGDGKFSEEWNNSVHNQKGLSVKMLNIAGNVADDYARGVAADAVISEVAGKYGLDPNDFKQTGFGRLQPGEYDVDKFLKAAAAAPAPEGRKKTGLKSGFIDENTYIDSEGTERDVTVKSAATKRGLAKEAERPSVTPIGYDDSEDEASGRTSYDSSKAGPEGSGIGGASDEGDTGDTGGQDQASADAAGGSSMSSPFSKGGLAEQTQRALKSSRKKK